MVWIEEPDRVFIEKNSFRLFEGNPMNSDVFSIFALIPLKYNIVHMYAICIMYRPVKRFSILFPNASHVPTFNAPRVKSYASNALLN